MNKAAKKPEKPEVPTEIRLDEVELLKLENIQLKIQSLQQEIARLDAGRNGIRIAIEERLGIDDLTKYAMDTQTGKGRLLGEAQ